ncbi:hypothetical protein, partial [Elizabethkingia miricola]
NLSIQEAQTLFELATQLHDSINSIEDPDFGKVATSNILMGLSIELYLKSFMLAARNEGAVRGHRLDELFNEFPPIFQDDMRRNYQALSGGETLIMLGFKLSETCPTDRPNSDDDNESFTTLDEAIRSVANIFVTSRYFFEEVNNRDWAIVTYYYNVASRIAESIKTTLEKFLAGGFR